MNKFKTFILIFTFSLFFLNNSIIAHCEIPCGIYGDSVRVDLIIEHISTIEKAMISIDELSNSENVNYNQIVRWVVNKEKHAEEIQDIVSQYFLHQRIKPVDDKDKIAYEKYINQLTKLHEILVLSMKAKQSIDLTIIEKLNNAVEDFSSLYFHKH